MVDNFFSAFKLFGWMTERKSHPACKNLLQMFSSGGPAKTGLTLQKKAIQIKMCTLYLLPSVTYDPL